MSDDAPRMQGLTARLATAAEALLSAWGDFAPDARRRLVERIVAAAARSPPDVDKAAREALDDLVARWVASLAAETEKLPVEALRAAYLAIDGARQWPDCFLDTGRHDAFRDALRRALPRALPEVAPLDMPEQRL